MFPYLAPFKDWMKEVLTDREKNRIDINLAQPWVILTSGAKVIKKESTPGKDATEIKKNIEAAISDQTGEKIYNGCIIRNNINTNLNYSLNETIVGIDFTGKPIKVENESNKRISVPIIESVEIDTDGANNTLKTARVNIKCFSLKQLEMFQVFFLVPGMNLLLEFGNNLLQYKKYSPSKDTEHPDAKRDVSEVLIQKNDYESFVTEFKNYYKVDTKNLKKYLAKVEGARGTYDLIAGKATDFSFSVEEGGIYNVTLEISQGNQMSLAIPINIQNTTSTANGTPKETVLTFDQYIQQLCADMGLQKEKFKIDEKSWKNEFFNWGKVNDSKKDEGASDERYLSLRFILEVLMNYSLSSGAYEEALFRFKLPIYKVDGVDKEFLPIKIHKNLISSTDEIIFPNKTLPKFTGNLDKTDVIIAPGDGPKDRIDGSINGYSVETAAKVIMEVGVNSTKSINQITSPDDGLRLGNALNIFIKYKSIVEIWRKSYSRQDFLYGILNIINANSYGLFRIVYAAQVDGGKATVIDFKSEAGTPDDKAKIYRFKPTTINSIVRQFSFNFEMSNLVAGRTVFNAQKMLIDAYKKTPPADKENISLPPDVYKNFDNSMFANSDGWMSINLIDLEALKETYKDLIQQQVGAVSDSKDETTAKNITDIIAAKVIRFKTGAKDPTMLIYRDNEFIRKVLKPTDVTTKSVLTPIEVNLTIDGVSGLSSGEYFHIDGIPEIYNRIGVFQITNIKHSLNADGWTTTIEAGFRINPS